MIQIAGASRMSSVRGLNASPQIAIVWPASLPKWASSFLSTRRSLPLVHLDPALRIWKS